MVSKFIAKAVQGQEFLFSRSSMIGVPASSALKIATALNNSKYELKEGQIWHVYDNDFYYNDFISREIKRYGKRMPIYIYYG